MIVSKMVLYQSAIITFFVLEKYVIGEFTILITSIPLIATKLVTVTLLYIESLSIVEGWSAISGVNIFSKFKEMLSRGRKIKDDIKDITQ